jgi:hypothetical protein
MTPRRPLRISVRATATPEPHLLRAAIAARLAGRPFPTRVEDAIAAKVASAVNARAAEDRAC